MGVTAAPGRPERWGRGAARLRRAASERWGFGGPSRGPPSIQAGRSYAGSRGATAPPGRPERWGVWGGHLGAPHLYRPDVATLDRGVPRLRRGAPSAGGFGGPSRGPPSIQAGRRDAGSRGATAPPGRPERWGVWGAISGPPLHTGRASRRGGA